MYERARVCCVQACVYRMCVCVCMCISCVCVCMCISCVCVCVKRGGCIILCVHERAQVYRPSQGGVSLRLFTSAMCLPLFLELKDEQFH